MAQTYCDAAPGHEWHGPYHEREYGFPLEGDAELFERLVLESAHAPTCPVFGRIIDRRPPWFNEKSVSGKEKA